MTFKHWAVFAALAVFMSACGLAGTGESPDGSWQLQSGTLNGQPINLMDGYPTTLTFDGVHMGGTAACNGYGGEFKITGGGIVFSDIAITEMACGDAGVMLSEAEFMQALIAVDTIETGQTLRLTGGGAELVFVALPPVPTAELLGTVWVLDGLITGDAISSVSGERATLEFFSDGSVLGSTGCRTLHGSYTVAGSEVQMTSLSAAGDCTTELAGQDNQVVSVLEGGFSVEVDGRSLTITATGDEGLHYQAES